MAAYTNRAWRILYMKFVKVIVFSLASTAALTIAGFGSISARADESGCNNNVHLTQS